MNDCRFDVSPVINSDSEFHDSMFYVANSFYIGSVSGSGTGSLDS